MEIEEFTFRSTSRLCDIWGRKCINGGVKPKAVIQLVHGMVEHSLRCNGFIQELCDEGYVCYMHDNLGHGKSVKNDDDLGFFGGNDGYKYLVEDVHKVTEIAKEDYPNLPIILFGHSMGSFIVRAYTAKYGDELAGAIYCGTAGSNAATGAGLAFTKLMRKFKGDHYRSKAITNLAFGAYNKRTEKAHQNDWISRDQKLLDAYNADPLCGFEFTTSGYVGLLSLNKLIGQKTWYQNVPAKLPILLMAGEEDPVGNYGKGVREVYDKLLASGHKDVTLHLYEDDRHEILNELDKKAVIKDTLNWIKKVLNK